jgi:molybdenum cofactor cytidylyltransferase
MKFGAVAPKQAIGATAVHTIRQGGLILKKGTLIGATEADALEAAGIDEIVVARLEAGDVSEDVAAAEIAAAIAGEGVHVDRAFTGRANLFARGAGILSLTRTRSTSSIGLTRRLQWRRLPPISRSLPAR